MHIAVLKGGLSSEREVSLVSGQAVAEALRALGYEVTELDAGHDIGEALAALKPDVAFNALHGTYGEDGCIQGVLEYLQIPYTHSGVRASALAMHKPTAKRLFESIGILCAPGEIATRDVVLANDVLPRPYVIKPLDEGSSVGVRIVMEGDVLVPSDIPESDMLLVEQYIPGRELTVAVMDNEPLGVCEIRPKEGFYDYRNKYTAGMTDYLVPAPLDEAIYQHAMEIGQQAHMVLDCRGVSRADLRLSEEDNKLYMLEVNTHPGMTPTSLVPKLAVDAGIDFNMLVDRLVQAAQCDHG